MEFKSSLYLDTRKPKKSTNLYPVKLQLYSTITRKQKYYSTGYDLSKDDFYDMFKSGVLVRGEKKVMKIYLEKFESKAFKVAREMSPFTFEMFEKKMFRSKGANINIQYHYNTKITTLRQNDQISTASNYELSFKSFSKFLEAKYKTRPEKLTFYDITSEWLQKYENYMVNDSNKSRTTVSIYLRTLRTIFNDAISENDIKQDIYPFGKGKGKYSPPATIKVKKSLGAEQLKTLFNEKPMSLDEEKARDFWFFSFACNGMNIKDILLLKYDNIDDDTLKYFRAKTQNTKKSNLREMRVFLNDYSKDIIKKYGKKVANGNDYVFSIISKGDDVEEQQRKIKNFTSFVNHRINKIASRVGIDKISTYYARHSWTTQAIRGGSSIEFVSEALNHSSLDVTKNYFAGFEDKTKKEFSDKLMNF